MNKGESGKSFRLIETQDFPFEFVSTLAERESWRKEIYRPIYHVHKWWAKRLGSVFRAILLGSALHDHESLEDEFYNIHDFSNTIIFDPFMGSGTTIGEAHKLGMTTLGRDINPVACESIRVALSPINRNQLLSTFQHLSSTTGHQIRKLYQTIDENGDPGVVLYYFWVKQINCLHCASEIDLFSSYIFAQHAYPKKKPEVQVYCPTCGDIFQALYHQEQVTCHHCQTRFNPRKGTANGAKATCNTCGHVSPIIQSIQTTNSPPKHKLYAKLVLADQGIKKYLPAVEPDYQAYAACEQRLKSDEIEGLIQLPNTTLFKGHNTRQAMRYNYYTWRDFFNARQLLALGWLHESIINLSEGAERDALFTLFSGTLEFNNLFASYKGEGTGAVRHMFSHHTLKPERTPIEANIWGTAKSSGSFSGLFRSRILRALDYRDAPFEVGLNKQKKIFNVSKPIGVAPLGHWGKPAPGEVALSCGDSTNSGLPSNSVDLVVTDPPFFDNVHYSELADFFYAWQKLSPHGFINEKKATTRQNGEVQDIDSEEFSTKLQAVFRECWRVLKDDGLLVFTYHHSHAEGWTALANAIYGAQFTMVQAHPVRAELAVATPKSQTKEPILIDAVIVCRKQKNDSRLCRNPKEAIKEAVNVAADQINRLAFTGYSPTEGDKYVIAAAQFFVALGSNITASFAVNSFREQQNNLLTLLTAVNPVEEKETKTVSHSKNEYTQLTLSF